MAGQQNGDTVSARAAKCYREEQINGLSQKELLLMLYDGAIKFATEAKEAIEQKNFIQSYKLIVRGREIVTELLRILDIEQGGEVAKNLQRLYVYVIGRLTEVNFTKETRLLDNAIQILQTLRSAWAELDFDKAMASIAVPDNGEAGSGALTPNPGALRKPLDTSHLLSITA